MKIDCAFENFRFFPAYSVETLAEQLAHEIARRDDPFVPETVLITNYAQRIWLQHYLAQKNGICANIRFVSPESFLNKISFPDGENPRREKLFDRDALAWRIFGTLREIHAADSAVPQELRFPFRENRDEDFILTAQMLADLFWRYQSFRTEMIVAWTQGKDIPELRTAGKEFKTEYARQKHLWQKLNLREEEIPAMRYRNFYEGNSDSFREKLPKRLFVFAPTALPKTHFEMLKKLSNHTQILLYYHNLSDNFWIDSRNRKSTVKKPQSTDRGNELLTSWGKAARALAGELIELNLLGGTPNGDAAPARDSLLHRLQANIRENIVGNTFLHGENLFSAAERQEAVAARDTVSLRVHSAYSRMREMEILRDDLRDLMTRDNSVRPRDILVMLPDIDAYAPFIRAVFENSEFPFSLADSTGAERLSGISAFLSLLKIAQGEVRLSELCALIDSEAVVRALTLGDSDADALKKILAASNIRWGLDAASRAQKLFGDAPLQVQNPTEASRVSYNNSWNFGLRRCALGVMLGDLPPASESPLEFGEAREIVPAKDLPENAATLLGKFSRIIEAVKTLAALYAGKKKRIAEWCRFLKCDLADTLLDFPDDAEEEEIMLADAIDSVRSSAENAGIADAEVSLKTVISMLENRSWESERGSGMLRGKITFCRLQPLRNIPAKAIYIAGMNSGEFPRSSRSSALDLIALQGNPSEWDRTPRDEDCLLLLEAVLAAKTYLRFSYIGRNAKNNLIIHPCTPLSKLIDEVAELQLPPGLPEKEYESSLDEALKTFFFEHAPQSPETERLLSAETEKNSQAQGRETPSAHSWRPPLFPQTGLPLSLRERERFSEISADDVAAFFMNPAKFLYEKRFHLKDIWQDKTLSDCDPEMTKIKSKELLPQLLNLGFETLTNPDLETQNEIVGQLQDAVQKQIGFKRASGDFPALTNATEDGAATKDLELKTLNKRHNSWAKVIGKSIVSKIEKDSDAYTVKVSLPGEAFPQKICIRVNCEEYRDTDDASYFVKTFPQCYSTGWEFRIGAVVIAAFLRAVFPQKEFTFVAIHPNLISRTAASVLRIESRSLPENYADKLIRRFFSGLENPLPFLPDTPISTNTPEEFREKFLDAEKKEKDFVRKFRNFVFGSDIGQVLTREACEKMFTFVGEINSLFPQPKRKKLNKD